jgi:hypothetical protein
MFRRRATPGASAAGTDPAAAGPGTGARYDEPATTAGPAPVARRRRLGRGRAAGAAAVGTAGAGLLALARLVMLVATLIFLLIVVAIVLRDVDANASNSIVKGIHDGANFFAGSFTDMIKETRHYKRAITINWGIAAIVYLLVGAVISGLIRRVGRSGAAVGRRAAAY